MDGLVCLLVDFVFLTYLINQSLSLKETTQVQDLPSTQTKEGNQRDNTEPLYTFVSRF